MKKQSDQNLQECNRTKKECGLLKTIHEGMAKLADGVKRNNELYDESIREIQDWERQQNAELKMIKDSFELRYGADTIDMELEEKRNEQKREHRNVIEKIRREEAETEQISRKIDELLKGK